MAKYKCAWCGKRYYEKSLTDSSDELFKTVGQISNATKFLSGKKRYCSEACRVAAEGSGGGSGGSVNAKASIAAEKERRKTAQIEAELEETKREEAAHRELVKSIKEFEFPEDDDAFLRATTNFIDGYSECHPGFFADKEYKTIYKNRMESELKILKESNQKKHEKLKNLWEEAEKTMQKKLKTRLIISASITGGSALLLAIIFAIDKGVSGFFSGLVSGLIFGGMFGFFIHTDTFGKGKKSQL